MADTRVQLGDVIFASYEVPERIPFGGEQQTVMHKLLGGARRIDAMGTDDLLITWSGRFQGTNATDRAKHLDYLRRQGVALTLSWHSFLYSVVIKTFRGSFERFYQIPYEIACEVVQDLSADVPEAPAANFDEAINRDHNDAQAIGAGFAGIPGLSAVSGALGTLQGAVQAVPSFIGATSPQLAKVMSAITGAQTATLTAQNAANLTATAPGLIGSIVAGDQPLSNINRLKTQASNMGQLSDLTRLSGTLGRMRVNVLAAGH